jgi:hypothetical protein
VSDSASKQRTSALKTFEEVLKFVNKTNFKALQRHEVDISLLGKLADYIFTRRKSVKKSATALAILSHVKSELDEKFKPSVFIDSLSSYTRLREQVRKRYKSKRSSEGLASADCAKAVFEDDLRFMGEVLHDMNNTRVGNSLSNEVRACFHFLLVMDRVLAGRISEVRNITYQQMMYNSRSNVFVVSLLVS